MARPDDLAPGAKPAERATLPLKSERIGAQLTPSQIADQLPELRGWDPIDDGRAIRRTFELPSFRAAIAFVAYVAELAEAADHHPDIDIRYDRVTLTLTTHSEGHLTGKDLALARLISS